MRAMLFSLKPGQRFIYGQATYTRLGFGNPDGEGDGALLLWFIGRKLLSPALARELFLNSEWFFAGATADGHVAVFTRDEEVEVVEPAAPAKVKWCCTNCAWEGPYDECAHVMYRGRDWEQCPSCHSVAIPESYQRGVPSGAALTPQETFILDMASCLNDAINNCTGLLRSVAERLDPSVTDEVHGSVRDFLLREVDDLQKKRRRGMEKIVAFAGGPEEYRDMNKRWWEQDPIEPDRIHKK